MPLAASRQAMLIVGIDTSGRHGGIALARIDGDQCLLLEETEIAGGTFSAQLIPQLASLLQKYNFQKQDLGAVSVASGPGSFTGLRIGLAAGKGLAEILRIPIAAVSLLEAVALAAQQDGDFATVLDAGRGEFYVGEYRVVRNIATLRKPEMLLAREELLAFVTQGGVLVTPEPAIPNLFADARVRLVQRPGAAAIAEIGARKLRQGNTVSAEELDVNYIRRSDAEIFAKKIS